MKNLKLRKETITKLNDENLKKFVGGIRRAIPTTNQSCANDTCNSLANPPSCGDQSCSCEAHAPSDEIN